MSLNSWQHLQLKKIEIDDKKNIAPFIPSQKQKQLSNESNINDVFEPIYTTIISNIQTSLRKAF